MQTDISWTVRSNSRLWSGKGGDALAGQDGLKSETLFDTVIDRVWNCTGWSWSSQLGDGICERNDQNREMHCAALINQASWCNWRPKLTVLRLSLGGGDRTCLAIHWEAMIVPLWSCHWRPRLWKLRAVLGGSYRMILVMKLQTEIKWKQRSTVWPYWMEFGDALGGHLQTSMNMHLVD